MKRAIIIFLFAAFWTLFLFGAEKGLAISTKSPDLSTSYWYVTKSGYIAATNEVLLDYAVALAVSGNHIAFKGFIDTNPSVFPLKGGLRVHIEESSCFGKVKIMPKDSAISVWTVREAIK